MPEYALIDRVSLAAILPRAVPWAFDPLNKALLQADAQTPLRIAMFLAQYAVESDSFRTMEENLNYSAARLVQVFPKHFTPDQAAAYAGHPEAIANRAYANRYGNGDEASGDGYRYRGRGLTQLTFKNNYQAFSDFQGVDFVASPDLIATPAYAFRVGAWLWKTQTLNSFADTRDVRGCTLRINGGLNGVMDRQTIFDRACRILGV